MSGKKSWQVLLHRLLKRCMAPDFSWLVLQGLGTGVGNTCSISQWTSCKPSNLMSVIVVMQKIYKDRSMVAFVTHLV